MTRRRFPPPWTFEEANNAFFIVKDANGFAVSYVYFEDEPGRRAAANLMTKDEARRFKFNTYRAQISNSTPISMICALGILKYAPGRWALWCMNANSSSRQRAKPGRRPDGMIVS